MHRRKLALLAVFVTLTLALAQDMTGTIPIVTSELNYEIRLSIVESRLGRVESDLSALTTMPASLARMEATLEAVADKATGAAGVLQTVGLGIVMSVITSVIVVRGSVKDKKKE